MNEILAKFIGVNINDIQYFKDLSIGRDLDTILLNIQWIKKSRISEDFFKSNLSLFENKKNFITSYFHSYYKIIEFKFYPLDQYHEDFYKISNY